jgi:hypothetical protein
MLKSLVTGGKSAVKMIPRDELKTLLPEIQLNVGDMGNIGGLAMIANLGANLTSSESDERYTKNVDVAGRKIYVQ